MADAAGLLAKLSAGCVQEQGHVSGQNVACPDQGILFSANTNVRISTTPTLLVLAICELGLRRNNPLICQRAKHCSPKSRILCN